MAKIRTMAKGDAFPWRWADGDGKHDVQFSNRPVDLPDEAARLAMRNIPGRLEIVPASRRRKEE